MLQGRRVKCHPHVLGSFSGAHAGWHLPAHLPGRPYAPPMPAVLREVRLDGSGAAAAQDNIGEPGGSGWQVSGRAGEGRGGGRFLGFCTGPGRVGFGMSACSCKERVYDLFRFSLQPSPMWQHQLTAQMNHFQANCHRQRNRRIVPLCLLTPSHAGQSTTPCRLLTSWAHLKCWMQKLWVGASSTGRRNVGWVHGVVDAEALGEGTLFPTPLPVSSSPAHFMLASPLTTLTVPPSQLLPLPPLPRTCLLTPCPLPSCPPPPPLIPPSPSRRPPRRGLLPVLLRLRVQEAAPAAAAAPGAASAPAQRLGAGVAGHRGKVSGCSLDVEAGGVRSL